MEWLLNHRAGRGVDRAVRRIAGFAPNVDWDSLLDGNFKQAGRASPTAQLRPDRRLGRGIRPADGAPSSANDIDSLDPGDLLSPRRTALRGEFFGSWDKLIASIPSTCSNRSRGRASINPCWKSALVAGASIATRHTTVVPALARPAVGEQLPTATSRTTRRRRARLGAPCRKDETDAACCALKGYLSLSVASRGATECTCDMSETLGKVLFRQRPGTRRTSKRQGNSPRADHRASTFWRGTGAEEA